MRPYELRVPRIVLRHGTLPCPAIPKKESPRLTSAWAQLQAPDGQLQQDPAVSGPNQYDSRTV